MNQNNYIFTMHSQLIEVAEAQTPPAAVAPNEITTGSVQNEGILVTEIKNPAYNGSFFSALKDNVYIYIGIGFFFLLIAALLTVFAYKRSNYLGTVNHLRKAKQDKARDEAILDHAESGTNLLNPDKRPLVPHIEIDDEKKDE